MTSDAQLIQQVLEGRTEAFGRLIQRYQDRLLNAVLHVVGRREDAEDVVQDAFVQAFLKLDTFRGRSAFFTWLYRIAFNQSITRRRKRRPNVSLDALREDAGREPTDANESPAERLERLERAEQLQQAMAALSEEHRVILALREIDGCDYETIGQILELPVGTVRSRLHRARLQLRDRLNALAAHHPGD